MKRVARVAMLGMVLQGSAHAAAPGAAAEPSLNKGSVIQSAPQAKKKSKAGAAKAGPKAKTKQDSMMENPAESTDQSVQLRGVRG